MINHMHFDEYLIRRQGLWMEMSNLRRGEKLEFGEDDQKYLKQFKLRKETDNLLNIWMQAIMYRYSPAVLMHPEQEEHEVPITITKKGLGYRTEVYKVSTYTSELLHRIEGAGFEPAKIDLKKDYNKGRQIARAAAEKELAFAKGKPIIAKRGKNEKGEALIMRGSINLPGMKKEGDFVPLQPNKSLTRGERIEVPAEKRSIVKLDDRDKEFLAWFDKEENSEFKNFKIRAFEKRYNTRSKGLINLPRKEGDPEGNYLDIPFEIGHGSIVAKNVPVYANHLAARIRKMSEEGGPDFNMIPLPYSSAKRWVERGYYQAGGGVKDRISFLGKKKQETIRQFIKDQDAYLADPEGTESPSTWVDATDRINSAFYNFNHDVPWMKILEQEAKIILNKAVTSARRKYSEDLLSDEDKEDLYQDMLNWLSREETVSNPQYREQAWRINTGKMVAWIKIRDDLREQGKIGDKEGDVAARYGKSAVGFDIKKVGIGLRSAIRDVLQQMPEADQVPPDADWEEIIDAYLRNLGKWQQEHPEDDGKANQTMKVMLAKDTLQPFMMSPLAVAAKRPPLSSKINPINPIRQPPN